MKSRSLQLGIALAAAGLCLQPLTATAAKGDWLLRGGIGIVDPKSDNLTLSPEAEVQVGTGTSFTLEGTYMLADHWGVELLLAYPFTHDVDIDGAEGAGNIAQVDHLPPTLSLQYHFNPNGKFRPYIGAGLNYTTFFNEKTKGALSDTSLELDDSWGAAGQIGADVSLNDNWFLNLAVRYIDIDSDAKLTDDVGTTELGTVEIDPFIYQAQVGYRFGRPAPVVAAAPVAAAVAAPPPPPPPPRPSDTDGDGVVDANDQCPDTPKGDRVGPQGCSCDVTRQLQFKLNSAELTAEDRAILDEVAENLKRLKFVSGTVVGHTDSSGSDAYNQKLSERRAQSVATYLEGKGIAEGRLKVSGAGESQPIADNATAEGRAQNRRVVLKRTDCDAPN
ncbi:MAG: OmpA family protein [Chromatiales bacterium]|nr:OmpA family protein [Chromatiales bacterium]